MIFGKDSAIPSLPEANVTTKHTVTPEVTATDIYYDSALQADHRECLNFDHPIEKYGVIDA